MIKMLRSIALILILSGCFTMTTNAQEKAQKPVSIEQINSEEEAVKAFIEDFLYALGNDQMEKLKTMFVSDANVASVRNKDGKPSIKTNSIAKYLVEREAKENAKFEEPVQKFTVEISQDMLAFVRADATIISDEGVPSHHTHDFFILIKEEGRWKIFSASYTTLPLESEGEGRKG